MQYGICILFIKAGDKNFDGNQVLYSVTCPNDSLDCKDLSIISTNGWLLCCIILLIYLLPDFFDASLLIYESILMRKLQGLITGIMLMDKLVVVLNATFIYLRASSASDIMIIKETVLILFFHYMDEFWYRVLKVVAPKWLDQVENSIFEYETKSCDKALAVENEIFSLFIEKLRKKIECIEQLPEKVRNDLKNICDLQMSKPDNSNKVLFNQDEHNIRWNQLMHNFSKARTSILCEHKKKQFLGNKNETETSRGQQKITDFFQPKR